MAEVASNHETPDRDYVVSLHNSLVHRFCTMNGNILMIQSCVYQKSIRARGLCHFGRFSRVNMAFEIDLIKIQRDITVQ